MLVNILRIFDYHNLTTRNEKIESYSLGNSLSILNIKQNYYVTWQFIPRYLPQRNKYKSTYKQAYVYIQQYDLWQSTPEQIPTSLGSPKDKVIIYYMIEFYLKIKGMKLQANVKTSLNFKRIRESQRSQSLHDLLYVKCGEWAEKAISSCLEVGKTKGRWEVIFLVQGFFTGMMDHGQIPVMVTQSREYTWCYEMVYLIQMNCKI